MKNALQPLFLSLSRILVPTSLLVSACGSDSSSAATTVAATQPNADVGFFGVDGEFSLDLPGPSVDGKPVCTADYNLPAGRNIGGIVLSKNETISFYADRELRSAIATGCTYKYLGYKGDPHYFGPSPDKYPTSVWMTYELAGGPATCERFHFVALRPPHGDGDVKHMHARWGGKETTIEALLQMSLGAYDDADKCNPWWSVYCTKGNVGCDN